MTDAVKRHGKTETFYTVQVLRGVAAAMVVVFHTALAARDRLGGSPVGIWGHGTAGVDIFFVISGFVMVLSSQTLIKRTDGWRVFIWQRLMRIVPLYWLLTSIKLATIFVSPSLSHHGQPDLTNIICSYLFIPSLNGAGELLPVLPPGWTLSFEMLFYAVFAIALATGQNILKLAGPFFLVLLCLALLRNDGWPAWTALASDLPIEFLFGVLVGQCTLHRKFLPTPVAIFCLPLAFLAFAVFSVGPVVGQGGRMGHVSLRVLAYGVPAFFLVASAVALERRVRFILPRLLLVVGDASYSIYLVHGFILGALVAITEKTAIFDPGMFIVAGVTMGTLGGVALYYAVELPILRTLRAMRRPPGFALI